MPIYEYRCRSCGEEFEALRNLNEADADGTCPACRGKAQRLMSGFAAQNGTFVRGPEKVQKRGTW